MLNYDTGLVLEKKKNISVAGTWTRVSRVRAEYPDQLDYNGFAWKVKSNIFVNKCNMLK